MKFIHIHQLSILCIYKYGYVQMLHWFQQIKQHFKQLPICINSIKFLIILHCYFSQLIFLFETLNTATILLKHFHPLGYDIMSWLVFWHNNCTFKNLFIYNWFNFYFSYCNPMHILVSVYNRHPHKQANKNN